MKKMKIGRYMVPVWVISVLLISIIGAGVMAGYVWETLNIPVHVNEPLKVLSYPSEFNLYPGDTEEFNISIQNYASNNYSVVLVFNFGNSTYQANYVNFSNTVYTIVPGQQNITAWFSVKSNAPPTSDTLSLGLQRVESLSFHDDFDQATLKNGWNFIDVAGNSTLSLADNPGWLRMTTISPPGRDLYGPVQNAPHIDRSGISGNPTVETKVNATMDQNDEGAGILVWTGPNSHLRFERMSRTIGNPVEQQIVLTVEGGSWANVVLQSNVNPTYLRLIKSGDLYSGYYSSDGTNWYHVGDVVFQTSGTFDVGLDIINMYHSGTFFADFDYFYMTVS